MTHDPDPVEPSWLHCKAHRPSRYLCSLPWPSWLRSFHGEPTLFCRAINRRFFHPLSHITSASNFRVTLQLANSWSGQKTTRIRDSVLELMPMLRDRESVGLAYKIRLLASYTWWFVCREIGSSLEMRRASEQAAQTDNELRWEQWLQAAAISGWPPCPRGAVRADFPWYQSSHLLSSAFKLAYRHQNIILTNASLASQPS